MQIKETLWVLTYSLFKTPMVAFLLPRVEKLDETECRLRIPLSFRSKNPLRSMYFGALAAGGDVAGSLIAYYIISKKKLPVSLVFKDVKMDFVRRAESDVTFICRDGEKISALLDRAMASGERVSEIVRVEAVTYEKGEAKVCTTFDLTLSLKRRKEK